MMGFFDKLKWIAASAAIHFYLNQLRFKQNLIMCQLTVTYNNLSDFSLIHLISKGVFVKCAEFVYLCN